MSASSSLKGKGRAPDSTHPQSPPPPAPPTTKPPFRHGRGPIIPDDDDPQPPTGTLIVHRSGEGDDERTHLLYARPGEPAPELESLAPGPARRRRAGWKTCALVGALSVAFALLLLGALVHLWVGHVVSEQGRKGGVEEMVRRGIRVEGPFQVGVGEGQGESEVLVKVNLSVGVDARSALGWEDKDSKKATILHEWEAWFARRAVRTTDSVLVDLSRLALFTTQPNGTESTLVVVPSLNAVRVPVSYPRAGEGARTAPLSLNVPVRFPDPEAAAKFAAGVWNAKKYAVNVRVDGVEVHAGRAGQKGVSGWVLRKFGKRRLDRVEQKVDGTCKLDRVIAQECAALVADCSLACLQCPTCPGHPTHHRSSS